MQAPLEIASRDFTLTDPLKDLIYEQTAMLEEFFNRITSCHVTVEAPEIDHHHKGEFFKIKILLNVPGKQLVANRQTDDDFHMATREAFKAMRRELEDYVREMRGDVKIHEKLPLASITRLFPEEDYGFLTTDDDDRQIYFHRNSLVDADLDDLSIGTEVQFVEQEGAEGPQASTVKIVK